MRKKYEEMDAIELDNLDQMCKFLEIQKLAKQIQKETENLNSTITFQEIE